MKLGVMEEHHINGIISSNEEDNGSDNLISQTRPMVNGTKMNLDELIAQGGEVEYNNHNPSSEFAKDIGATEVLHDIKSDIASPSDQQMQPDENDGIDFNDNEISRKRSLSPGNSFEASLKKFKADSDTVSEIPLFIRIFAERAIHFLDADDLQNFALTCKENYRLSSKAVLWGLSFLRCGDTLKGHLSTVTCLARIKSYVFSGSLDGKVKVWDSERWSLAKTIAATIPAQPQPGIPPTDPRQIQEISCQVICLETCEDLLYIGLDSGYVTLNNIGKRATQSSGVRRQLGHQAAVKCLRVSADKLYSGGADSKIAVYEAKTLRPLKQLRAHKKAVIAIEVIENRLFSASEDGNICVWNLFNLNIEAMLTEDLAEQRNSFKEKLSHGDKISSMCAVQSQRKIISCGWDCKMKMWDSNSLKLITYIFLNPLSICWNLTIRMTREFPMHLVCAVREGEIELRSLEDLYLVPGTSSQNFSSFRDGHESWINAAISLPDGRIVTGSDDWTLKVWNIIGSDADRKSLDTRTSRKAEFQRNATNVMESFFGSNPTAADSVTEGAEIPLPIASKPNGPTYPVKGPRKQIPPSISQKSIKPKLEQNDFTDKEQSS